MYLIHIFGIIAEHFELCTLLVIFFDNWFMIIMEFIVIGVFEFALC